MKTLLRLLVPLLFASVSAMAQTILPDATAGTAYSFQVTTNPPQPAGTVYTSDGLPTGLSIDASSGLISGTTATVGTFSGDLKMTINSETAVYPFHLTVDPAAGTPVITSPGSAVGTVGTSFTYTLTASNNPTSYNIATLPPGLTAAGPVISGTPTAAGLYFTSVSANNANGEGAILVIMWTINPAGPVPTVTSVLLASTPVGTPFTYQITGTNSPTSFGASGLPAGLTLNSATGVISGTPASAGISTVVLSASNSYGAGPTVNLTLTVGDYSAITSATSLSATVGTPFTYTLTASNNPYTFSLSGLPAGLAYNNVSGLVTGTPTAPGIYTLTASATNVLGAGAPTTLTLTVAGGGGTGGNLTAPYILVGPASQTAAIGSTIEFSVAAVGSGTLTYQWSLNNIPIPGATGPVLTLAGVTASEAGSYTVTVANAIGTATSNPASLSVTTILVPPAITLDPAKATVSVGMTATFSVVASGTEPLSYQWEVNGNPIAGATAPTLTLPSVKLSDAGTYGVVVTNGVGSATSAGAALTVSAAPIAPIFQYQPTSTAVAAGGTASFSVGVVGSSPITYQWYKGSAAIPGANGPSLTLANVTAADAASYYVTITNPAGTVTSSTATLSLNAAGSAPVPVTIAYQPQPASVPVGGGVAFSVAVTGDPTITYQWRKNQAPIAGATGPSFILSNVQNSDGGTYDVVVANGFSATISFPTPLIVTPVTVQSHLWNISVLGQSGPLGQALTAGFIIGGTGTKSTLVRAVGPGLAPFGITGTLADPTLTIDAAGGSAVFSNDNWGGTAALTAAFAQTGAFPLTPNSLDSAILTSLPTGAYSAVVGANGSPNGKVLLELYDADSSAQPSARFVNLSVRGVAGPGSNILTIGFVVAGPTSKSVLIRAVGPTLASFGAGGVLPDPVVYLFDQTGDQIAGNSTWGGAAALVAAFQSVGAFSLPSNSNDSALLVSVAPGVYSAQVTTASNATGLVLLEIYELP